MPKFTVGFSKQVTYLPDHPKGRRIVTELEVSAPDGQAAIIHAIRVVAGDFGDITVRPSTQMPTLPAVEVA